MIKISQDLIHTFKLIGAFLFIVVIIVLGDLGDSYYMMNQEKFLLDSLNKLQWSEIQSPLDMEKYEKIYKNDPVKEIYNKNLAFVSKEKNRLIFIQYNVFDKTCEMTIRNTHKIAQLFDYWSSGSTPAKINLKTYTVKDSICNQLYGYGKF